MHQVMLHSRQPPESHEQRRGKSKEQAVTAEEHLPGLCLLQQRGDTLGMSVSATPESPPKPGKDPEPWDGVAEHGPCGKSCAMDIPFLQVCGELGEHP